METIRPDLLAMDGAQVNVQDIDNGVSFVGELGFLLVNGCGLISFIYRGKNRAIPRRLDVLPDYVTKIGSTFQICRD